MGQLGGIQLPERLEGEPRTPHSISPDLRENGPCFNMISAYQAHVGGHSPILSDLRDRLMHDIEEVSD